MTSGASEGEENLFEQDKKGSAKNGDKKIFHIKGFRFLDKVAIMTLKDYVKQVLQNIDGG